jgi:hypothetical protein
MNPELLDKAIACGKTKWLKELIASEVPKLEHLEDTADGRAFARQWDADVKEIMANRGLKSLSQQKNPLTDLRNAIKVFNPHHPALAYVGFSAEQWIEINQPTSDKVGNRSTRLLDNTDAIVQCASFLLKSKEWFDVAAGLVVVTGRRSSEILKTASFTFATPYSIIFSGALKRGQEQKDLCFEIPTLVRANQVIDALKRLRSALDTSNLDIRTLNKKYSTAIAKSCDRHFRELVPNRDGEFNLYTHLFRSIYATIATFWYCPPTASELEFRAAIQGHYKVLDEKNPVLQRQIASSRHYFDYQIGDDKGNIDGRLGIKLNDKDVRVLDVFQNFVVGSQQLKNQAPKITTIRLFENDRACLHQLAQTLNCRNQPAAVASVLDLASLAVSWAERFGIEPTRYALDAKLSQLYSPERVGDETDSNELVNATQTNGEQQFVTTPAPERADEVRAAATVESPQHPRIDETWQAIHQLTVSVTPLVDAVRSLTEHLAANSRARERPSKRFERGDDASSSPLNPPNRTDVARVEQTKPASTKRGEVTVNAYIDAMIAYNNEDERPHADKWLISLAALKRLTKCNQNLIGRVLLNRAEELQQHHSLHQLSPLHNSKGRSRPAIEHLIHLD